MRDLESILRGADRVAMTGKKRVEGVKSLTLSSEDLKTGQPFLEDTA